MAKPHWPRLKGAYVVKAAESRPVRPRPLRPDVVVPSAERGISIPKLNAERMLRVKQAASKDERCEDCGDDVEAWAATKELWTKVVGDWEGGVFCCRCFEARVVKAGFRCHWLAFDPDVLEERAYAARLAAM